MKKLLITGFEPFGGESINPSWEAVKRLPDEINGYSLTKKCIPVVFGDAARIVIYEAEKISADIILCIGQAGGRAAITPELVGINLRYATIPDNNGAEPKDEKISLDGADAHFATLPVRRIVESIKDAGLDSQVSYSAGTYVCNDVLYTLLEHYRNDKKRIGFIHIPYCTEQSKEPSIEIDDIVKALTIAIKSIDE